MEGLAEEVTFELSLEQGGEGGHVKIWGGIFQARGQQGTCVLQGSEGEGGGEARVGVGG